MGVGISILVACAALGGAVASASEFRSAVDQEHQAFGDYYVGLRKLGPNASEAQKRELYKQTLAPAIMEKDKIFSTKLTEVEKSIRGSVWKYYKARIASVVPDWLKDGRNVTPESTKGLGDQAPTRVTTGPASNKKPGGRSEPEPELEKEPESSRWSSPGTPKETVQLVFAKKRPSPSPEPDPVRAPRGKAMETLQLRFSKDGKSGPVAQPSTAPAPTGADKKWNIGGESR